MCPPARRSTHDVSSCTTLDARCVLLHDARRTMCSPARRSTCSPARRSTHDVFSCTTSARMCSRTKKTEKRTHHRLLFSPSKKFLCSGQTGQTEDAPTCCNVPPQRPRRTVPGCTIAPCCCIMYTLPAAAPSSPAAAPSSPAAAPSRPAAAPSRPAAAPSPLLLHHRCCCCCLLPAGGLLRR